MPPSGATLDEKLKHCVERWTDTGRLDGAHRQHGVGEEPVAAASVVVVGHGGDVGGGAAPEAQQLAHLLAGGGEVGVRQLRWQNGD